MQAKYIEYTDEEYQELRRDIFNTGVAAREFKRYHIWCGQIFSMNG